MQKVDGRILDAAGRLTDLSFLRMKPEALLADLQCLFELYGDSFEEVMEGVVKALKDIVQERVSVASMKYNLAQYSCYHFQSIVRQGKSADMRILFKRTEDGALEVEMIGNRFFPADIYSRAIERIEYYLAELPSELEDIAE